MELKYKVWDKVNKKMYNLEKLYFKNNEITHVGIDCEGVKDEFQIIDINLVELLPYTGVKDINKKEIYKGYILKNRISGRLWIVGYKDAAFILSYENSNINLLYDYVREGMLEDFEIIGNIYEN